MDLAHKSMTVIEIDTTIMSISFISVSIIYYLMVFPTKYIMDDLSLENYMYTCLMNQNNKHVRKCVSHLFKRCLHRYVYLNIKYILSLLHVELPPIFDWCHILLYIRELLCVCVYVCLSGYTFQHFSTDLLNIWREPSTGQDTFRGLYIGCVRNVRARSCVLSAYFWMDSVTLFWEHTTHHKWQGLRTFNLYAPRARALPVCLSTGYDTNRGLFMLCVHATRACACKARVQGAHVCIRLFFKRFSPNLLGTP
jgi:hypothetical protein